MGYAIEMVCRILLFVLYIFACDSCFPNVHENVYSENISEMHIKSQDPRNENLYAQKYLRSVRNNFTILT